jgi:hypothetical protein
MKRNEHIALRSLLWFICIYHVVCGLVPNLFPEQVPVLAESLAGMKIQAAPEFIALTKPFGIYAIAFGIMMGLAAWNPIKNRALISVGIILFLLRILQRLTGLHEAQEVFGVPLSRSFGTMAIVAGFAIALTVLRILLYRKMHQKETD